MFGPPTSPYAIAELIRPENKAAIIPFRDFGKTPLSYRKLSGPPAWGRARRSVRTSGSVSFLCAFMDVLLTRVTQQKLEMRLRNQGAETITTRRIILSSSYTWTVRFYTGPYHLLIDACMGGAE